MKRIFTLLLALALIAALIPAVFAASPEAEMAANALYKVGLFNGAGTDANGNPKFDLDRVPTRQEAVTMLVRLLGKDAEAKAGHWSIPFTDVAEWAKPYVGYAYTNGLATGTSATAFRGNDPVSAAQYLTFVLRVLGYTSGKDFQWNKSWELSDRIGLTNGQYHEGTKTFTRGDMALVSYQAMSLPLKNSGQTLQASLGVALPSSQQETGPTYSEVKIKCEDCDGTGKKICVICDGTGVRRSSQCRSCKGSGRSLKCYTCRGDGYRIGYQSNALEYRTPEKNTFVGTVNGQDVVGYLDNSSRFYLDGQFDYTGFFVIYDSNGNALHQLAVRIADTKSANTYTSGDGSHGLVVFFTPTLGAGYNWGSSYSTNTSDNWIITLSEVNCSDNGTFSGTINADLKPAAYGGKGLTGQVRITGAFNMQMQKVHSTAEAYRKANSGYDIANPHDFYQSGSTGSTTGTIPSTPDIPSSSGNKVDHTCISCKGSGRCTGCAGRGWKISNANGKVIDCARCRGSGRCQVCYGTGKIY